MIQANRPPVVVVFGGPSAEHDVSIVSGEAIAEALSGAGYRVRRTVIDLAGGWWWLPEAHRRNGRPQGDYDDPAALGAEGPLTPGGALDRLAGERPAPAVFIALHGPFGEDGTIQALFEAAGLAYTGAGVAASALAMDKILFKRLARGAGLPVADWHEIRADRWASDRELVLRELAAFARRTGDERLMVKPARLGSSVGMSLAHTAAERAPAVDLALGYDSLVLAERYLPQARDLEVAVIGNDPEALEVFGPGEIFPGHEFYDYAAKYSAGLSRTTASPDLPEPLRLAVRSLAAVAYRLIGCEGFARVDFLLAGDQLLINEINTIPGFTPISLFPTLPAQAGLDFGDVCRLVLELGLERHERGLRRRLTPADLPRSAAGGEEGR